MSIRMKALRSFGMAGVNEGHIKRGREFGVASDNRCRELEAHGLAYRVQALQPSRSVAPPPSVPVLNEAAENGPFAFDWWPDWRGRACAIIASGPSASQAPIAQLQGRLPVLAIKENVRLCPWADVVYGCDAPWWRARKGLPDFRGLKLAHNSAVCADYPDLNKIEVVDDDRFRFDAPGVVGSGGNSGFQAVNLAAQFGADRIMLIGFDMHTGGGLHWYGRNNWKHANNPGNVHLMRWRDAFEDQAPVLRSRGISVVNVSPDSALVCFPCATLDQTLKDWNL